MIRLAGMRALPLNATFWVLTMLLVWSLVRAARFGVRGAQATWTLFGRILTQRAMLVFLVLGACVNVVFSALAGYINPRDYLADVVAARQFLKHESMYSSDVPQMGIAELATPIWGREELQRLPVIRGELNTLTEPPAPGNPHPPVMGVAMAAPVFLFGFRGSFVFVLLLSGALLCVSVAAILHELFPPLPWGVWCAVMGLAFAWYPVGTTLRSGQPGIVLFALITAGWLMLRRDKPWLAGGAIGLAACLHAFPALLLLYFAIRSRRSFVSAVGTIALLNLAAAGLTIPQTFRQWLNITDANSQIFVPAAGNLSLAGLMANFSNGMGWGTNVKIIAPAMLLIIAGALAIFLWPWNRRDTPSERMDVEYSVFVAAMLLASPISWTRYLPIMILPLAVLIRNWRAARPAWAVPALLAALLFMSFQDSTFNWVYSRITQNLGFAAGWLASALTSFSILAILLWLGFPPHLTADADPLVAKAVPEWR
jgi:hypothetical protein